MPEDGNGNLDIARLDAGTRRLLAVIDLLGTAVRVAGAVAAVYIVMHGLGEIVLSRPESISALAKLAEAIKLGHITAYFLSAGLAVAWWRERRGKKRAIREKSRLQRALEADDPYRPSSGLTETGDTPEE